MRERGATVEPETGLIAAVGLEPILEGDMVRQGLRIQPVEALRDE